MVENFKTLLLKFAGNAILTSIKHYCFIAMAQSHFVDIFVLSYNETPSPYLAITPSKGNPLRKLRVQDPLMKIFEDSLMIPLPEENLIIFFMLF